MPDHTHLLSTTDAQEWASAWIATAAEVVARTGSFVDVLDEGWMIGWFANAIETGRDHGRPCPYVVTSDEGTSHCALAAAAGGNFVDDRHNLYAGWVLGHALKHGLPAEPVYDDDGIVTGRIMLHVSDGIDITLIVPPPPADWTFG